MEPLTSGIVRQDSAIRCALWQRRVVHASLGRPFACRGNDPASRHSWGTPPAPTFTTPAPQIRCPTGAARTPARLRTLRALPPPPPPWHACKAPAPGSAMRRRRAPSRARAKRPSVPKARRSPMRARGPGPPRRRQSGRSDGRKAVGARGLLELGLVGWTPRLLLAGPSLALSRNIALSKGLRSMHAVRVGVRLACRIPGFMAMVRESMACARCLTAR